MHTLNYSPRKLMAIASAFCILVSHTAFAGGSNNTALGSGTLSSNSGDQNSAFGASALHSNTGGNYNTANGAFSLYSNTNGWGNTASGLNALYYNIDGSYNTATGVYALYSNNSGWSNTASGAYALYSNSSGSGNTASGQQSLYYNSTGSNNTADGVNALAFNNADNNTASGYQALYSNSSGWGNTGSGFQALYNMSYGHNNIAIGFNSGYELRGSNNIDIANTGDSADNNTIRIGGGQNRAFIAGIYGVKPSGLVPVYINTAGQIYTVQSSQRFKKDIKSIDSVSGKLWQLRPVSFIYKEDEKSELQYGLIAEEVAKVYPELVQYDQEGKPFTVYYHLLAPLLLSEVQKAHARNDAQQAMMTAQIEKLHAQQAERTKLKQQLVTEQAEMTAMLQQQQQQQLTEMTALQQKLSQLNDVLQASSSDAVTSEKVALITSH